MMMMILNNIIIKKPNVNECKYFYEVRGKCSNQRGEDITLSTLFSSQYRNTMFIKNQYEGNKSRKPLTDLFSFYLSC